MNLTESIIQVLDPPDGEFIDRIQIIERLKVLDNSITGTVTTKNISTVKCLNGIGYGGL